MDITAATPHTVSDTLRRWALDEDLKARTMADPALAAVAGRVAARYTAGPDVDGALRALESVAHRGHRGSIECVGESVRDAGVASQETEAFVDLAERLGRPGSPCPAPVPTLSFDLSHLGSLVSPELGLANASRVAQAARDAGTSVMISAEGSDRTDLVLDLWERLSWDFAETGITLQARLHRTPEDLERVLRRPGPVRLVKGAFLEPSAVAYPRDSEPMIAAYHRLADRLLTSGHRVSLATHDAALVEELRTRHGDTLREDRVEFEMLQGLGTALLDALHADGFATREYIVYGPEWWLYVLNRIAEHPERVLLAVADLGSSASG
ncbi:proline dehydrogenase family protein [Arthrobacter woluwensis]|uniref:proline dehydrogenase family protein n=1 Tax=Arthrobacter woluwensis TaxID=156980 RepID=UPI001AAED066|nr:proline dehydrogenase family protein [Arthrobacter woluwensis]QTF71300.1 proline dehydrogenase [Arthrobacter woluwensis]